MCDRKNNEKKNCVNIDVESLNIFYHSTRTEKHEQVSELSSKNPLNIDSITTLTTLCV